MYKRRCKSFGARQTLRSIGLYFEPITFLDKLDDSKNRNELKKGI